MLPRRKLWLGIIVPMVALLCGIYCCPTAYAQPPMVTFPLPAGATGLHLPYNTTPLPGEPFPAGDQARGYGRQATSFGWLFDTFQATSIEGGSDSLGRYAPSESYDWTIGESPNLNDVVAMPEDEEWLFHVEFRHRGTHDSADADFMLFAKHSPPDYGAPSDGREDRMFGIYRGADPNDWQIRIGDNAGGWNTVATVQQTMDLGQTPPELYVDFDVHYKPGSGFDFYWEDSLVAANQTTGHGRYDLDVIQWEHKGTVDGTQDIRNFRLGTLASVVAVEGDYDGNGTVDIGDYPIWRSQLNQIGVGLAADGDDGTLTGTPDGIVDDNDYDFWKSRFGESTPLPLTAGASAAVPEPGGVTLALIASGCLGARRRRRTVG